MKLLTAIREAVRRWLGIDSLQYDLRVTVPVEIDRRARERESSLPSVEMYKAMELKQKERHEAVLAMFNAFMASIQNLEQKLQQAHAMERPQVFEYTDYESAMVAEMIKMQREPEKEH